MHSKFQNDLMLRADLYLAKQSAKHIVMARDKLFDGLSDSSAELS